MHARGYSLHMRMLADCRCVPVGDLLTWEHGAWPPVPSREPEEALPGAHAVNACDHTWRAIRDAWHACRWVIRFMGGAWCWDKASCQVRSQKQPYLMSTAMLPANTSATAHQDGIPDKVLRSAGITSIEAELNPFYSSWAHVHIWYCSSDSHLSDTAPGASPSQHRLMPAAMLPNTALVRASPARSCTVAWTHACASLHQNGQDSVFVSTSKSHS